MTETIKFISLRNDATFKYMMKSKNFRKMFNEIILDELGIDVSQYEFIDTELSKGNNKKTYKLDNLLRDINNDFVIIEMQNTEADLKNRYYLFRVAGDKLSKGEDYYDANDVLIQFDGYIPKTIKNINPEKKKLHYQIKEEDLDIKMLSIEIFEFVLPNYNKSSYNKSEKRLSLFMCESYEEMKDIAAQDELALKVVEELEMLSMDENFGLYYDAEVGLEIEKAEIRRNGHEEGKEEGKKESIIEVIKNLKKQNISDEIIMNAVSLTEEEYNTILKDIEK